MTYDVSISDQVKDLLEHLSLKNKSRCRQLALVLLRLKKDPKPPGSRVLRPFKLNVPGGMVWMYQAFEILYQVDPDKRKVFVAEVMMRH